ncbi:unnamed protein product [Arabidopsis halleri]
MLLRNWSYYKYMQFFLPTSSVLNSKNLFFVVLKQVVIISVMKIHKDLKGSILCEFDEYSMICLSRKSNELKFELVEAEKKKKIIEEYEKRIDVRGRSISMLRWKM